MSSTWGRLLVDQLDFYMTAHLMPRLAGLTDEEYFWEPVPACWSVRQRSDGVWAIDTAWPDPEPEPPPVTTIAWRLAHIAVTNLGARANAFFGDGSIPDEVVMFDDRYRPPVPSTADDAIALLEQVYAHWRDGIAGLDDEQLLRPLGPKGAYFANEPMAGLVMHVNRETIHHGAEIGVLRDLYRRRRYRSNYTEAKMVIVHAVYETRN